MESARFRELSAGCLRGARAARVDLGRYYEGRQRSKCGRRRQSPLDRACQWRPEACPQRTGCSDSSTAAIGAWLLAPRILPFLRPDIRRRAQEGQGMLFAAQCAKDGYGNGIFPFGAVLEIEIRAQPWALRARLRGTDTLGLYSWPTRWRRLSVVRRAMPRRAHEAALRRHRLRRQLLGVAGVRHGTPLLPPATALTQLGAFERPMCH